MKKREPFPDDVLERETRAIQAIDAAHKLPSGPARIEALKAAAKLRPGDAAASPVTGTS
jgi:hypothetical protein